MKHSGSHGAHSARNAGLPTRENDMYADKASVSDNTLKFVLLGVVLFLLVAVIVLLFVRGCNPNNGQVMNAAAEANVSSSVLAQDAYGKDMGKNLSVSAGTLCPSDVNPADAILLDISWDSKNTADYPLILTVSDASFVDGNGLIVFHYTSGQWVKVGTYTIADHAVTFLADSLSPFAFVPYEKYNTATPEPSLTPLPSTSPSPIPSVSPSPSKSPSPSPSSSPNANGNGNSGIYNYDPSEQYINPSSVPSTPTAAPIQTEEPVVDPTDPPAEETSSDIPDEGDDTE